MELSNITVPYSLILSSLSFELDSKLNVPKEAQKELHKKKIRCGNKRLKVANDQKIHLRKR